MPERFGPSIGWLAFCLALCVGAGPAGAEGLPEPREGIFPRAAAIASAHEAATRAGHEILEAGGNAFDAAVGITAVLAVVEPYSSGLGGGGFWLLHRAADGRQVVVDGREVAPLAAHRDLYIGLGGQVVPGLSVDGPLAAGIPGVPAALAHLSEHYGRLTLAECLEPAIELARAGFEVSAHYRRMASFRQGVLRRFPASARIFLDRGEVPEEGRLIRQPALADTLEALASRGQAGFYAGPVAEAMVKAVGRAGGIWSLEDLGSYRVRERAPVVGRYRGLRIVSVPPPSSGGVALVSMLNILGRFPLSRMDSAQRAHLTIEAMRLAYRDRAEHLGDPDFVRVPVDRLTDRRYARALAARIREDRVLPSSGLKRIAGGDGSDTTHFSILDREGNRVAATLSINYPFGSGFVAGDTGVLLNDEMDDFSVKPGRPNLYGLVGARANAIAPGKRPLSSMSPTFVEGPAGIAILGTPGGSRIISTVLLAILDLAEGNGPMSWVSRPRFHHQYLPDVVQYEPGGLSDVVQGGLRARGHRLRQLDDPYGNMQAVYWDRSEGRVTAASDPRVEGMALVQ